MVPGPEPASFARPIGLEPALAAEVVRDLPMLRAVLVVPGLGAVQEEAAVVGDATGPGGLRLAVRVALLEGLHLRDPRGVRRHQLAVRPLGGVALEDPGLVELEVEARVVHGG